MQRLLHRVAQRRVRVRTLVLDKGFCSTPVIAYLQAQQQAAIIACPIRGQSGGTRALGRNSYRTTYPFTDGTQVELAVVATLPPGSEGKRRRKWLRFVVIGQPNWSPKKVMRRYRRRFGIESSYRQMRSLRIFTNSVNPAWRFFILGLALLLLNIWRWLRWQFTPVLKPGPYRVAPNAFRLQRFVYFLRRAIEQIYEAIMSIPTHLPPRIVIH
jgi:putative transposase